MNSNLFSFADDLVAQTSVAAGEAVLVADPSIAGAYVRVVVRVDVIPLEETTATTAGITSPSTIHVSFGLCIRIHVYFVNSTFFVL